MSTRSLCRCLPAAILLVCTLLNERGISGVSLSAPMKKSGLDGPAFSGQLAHDQSPLFQLPPDTTIQEFAATRDLSAYALVYTRMKVMAHMEGKPKKLQSNATVVHNGAALGTYPDVIPFSLRLSPDGSSAAFGVVQWKTWNLPVYWFVRDGDRFDGTGHYTEDVEFQGLAIPWFSPDGSKVAYMIAVKNKRRIMVDEASVFTSQHARLENPWSPDGKHLALVTLKNGKERLVVDGAGTAEAGTIRIAQSPDTYIAVDDEGAVFFLDGSACVAGREIHDVVASPAGDRFALSMTDDDGALQVLLLKAPCTTIETWQDGGWKSVEALGLSSDGRRVFYAARSGAGAPATPLADETMSACGGEVVYPSVAMATGSERTAWIVGDKGKHRLCMDGKLLGTWDRIEVPLVFAGDGQSLSFYAWKNGGLYLKRIDW